MKYLTLWRLLGIATGIWLLKVVICWIIGFFKD
jgi:hypothetical protein